MTNMALGYGSVFNSSAAHGELLYDMLPSNWIWRNVLFYGVSAILICLGGAGVLASANGAIPG